MEPVEENRGGYPQAPVKAERKQDALTYPQKPVHDVLSINIGDSRPLYGGVGRWRRLPPLSRGGVGGRALPW